MLAVCTFPPSQLYQITEYSTLNCSLILLVAQQAQYRLYQNLIIKIGPLFHSQHIKTTSELFQLKA